MQSGRIKNNLSGSPWVVRKHNLCCKWGTRAFNTSPAAKGVVQVNSSVLVGADLDNCLITCNQWTMISHRPETLNLVLSFSHIYNEMVGQAASLFWRLTYGVTLTLTLTPTVNLVSPINLTAVCMSLDCGRKLEYQEITHANTGRTCNITLLHFI